MQTAKNIKYGRNKFEGVKEGERKILNLSEKDTIRNKKAEAEKNAEFSNEQKIESTVYDVDSTSTASGNEINDACGNQKKIMWTMGSLCSGIRQQHALMITVEVFTDRHHPCIWTGNA